MARLIELIVLIDSTAHVSFCYLSAAAAISFSSLEVMAPYPNRVEHHIARSKPGHEGGSPAIARFPRPVMERSRRHCTQRLDLVFTAAGGIPDQYCAIDVMRARYA